MTRLLRGVKVTAEGLSLRWSDRPPGAPSTSPEKGQREEEQERGGTGEERRDTRTQNIDIFGMSEYPYVSPSVKYTFP